MFEKHRFRIAVVIAICGLLTVGSIVFLPGSKRLSPGAIVDFFKFLPLLIWMFSPYLVLLLLSKWRFVYGWLVLTLGVTMTGLDVFAHYSVFFGKPEIEDWKILFFPLWLYALTVILLIVNCCIRGISGLTRKIFKSHAI